MISKRFLRFDRNDRLAPRVVRQDGGLPGGRVDVGVDLGGEDGLVAEHFLDDPQVRPAFDEVGGEGVAEGVRGDLLVDARGHRLVLDDVEDVDAAEGFLCLMKPPHQGKKKG